MRPFTWIAFLLLISVPVGADDFAFLEGQGDQATAGICDLKKPTISEICREVRVYCTKTFGSDCQDDDSYNLKLRQSNLILRQKIIDKTKDLFEKIKSDSDITRRCCGQDEKCKTRLSAQKLNILFGNSDAEMVKHVLPNEIQISEGHILAAKTASVIEASILHEYGHACQAARNGATRETYCDPKKGGKPEARLLSLADIGNTFGKTTEACVSKALNNSDQKPGEIKAGSCSSARVDEAFANMFLMHKWSSWSHWSKACKSLKNQAHDDPRRYLQCWLQSDEVQKKLCAPKVKKDTSDGVAR